MDRVLAIVLGCLLTASGLLARDVEETYQAALMEEKGEGRLEEAIRLYEQVIKAHEKGEGTDSLAARAQLRLGVCQEKLGLARARETYEAVIEEYPEEPQAGREAARHLRSARRRQESLEEWASAEAVDDSVAMSDWKDLREQLMQYEIRQQLQTIQAESLQLQVESLQRELKAIQQRSGGTSGPALPSNQGYDEYANTPAVIPYSYDEVTAVPMLWKFRLDGDGLHPQRHPYEAPDFDDTDWAAISIGQAWEDQGFAGYDQGAWYRTTITVTADTVRPVLMAFGGVDKDAFVYVNGQLVGQHHVWNLPFILDISDHVIRDGENVVAIYVYDGAYMGGVYGLINVHQPKEEIDIGDFAANRGGRLHMAYRGATWPGFPFHFPRPYIRHANRPPRIPYPHRVVAEVPMAWKFRLDVGAMSPHRHREYADPYLDDSSWADISIGQAWEDQGYFPYDEGAWYRTRFEVDAEEGRPVHLAFGGVDANAYVYVNGLGVGQHHAANRPFILDVSSQVVRDGENTVAIYVYDGTGMGGVYGLIQVLQPTGDENLDRYLANRGGEVEEVKVKRSFWSRFF